MAKRKERPTHMYREEVTAPGDPLRNHTRQTFNKEDFEAWKEYARTSELGHEWRFYTADIIWYEDDVVLPKETKRGK